MLPVLNGIQQMLFFHAVVGLLDELTENPVPNDERLIRRIVDCAEAWWGEISEFRTESRFIRERWNVCFEIRLAVVESVVFECLWIEVVSFCFRIVFDEPFSFVTVPIPVDEIAQLHLFSHR